MVEIKQSNPKAFQELDLKLKELENFQGRVGWGEDSKYPDGTPVAYVAAIQELGYGPIPPRPFMRPAETKNQNEWQAVAGFAAAQILDGKMTGADGMRLITTRAEDDVSDAISDVSSPPLSPITMVLRKWRREGRKITGATVGEAAARLAAGEKIDVSGVSAKPLNDTGRMLATLTSVVESVK